MKTQLKTLVTAMGFGMVLASGSAMAESQYGYDPAGGAAARTAQARLDITVTVPKLILLRVGADGAGISVAALNAALAGGIPGGVVPALAVNNTATGWDGTAPVWAPASSALIQAWAWTNASGGGELNGAVTTAFPGPSGLTAGNITVASAAVAGGGLAHPGLDTGTNATTGFVRNTLVSSNWTFSISAAALAGAAAGVNTQQMTYTASTL